jgi:hypothetical protein
MGMWVDQLCDPGICVPAQGCTLCTPGAFQCNGNAVEQCDPGGGSWQPVEQCDTLQGIVCDAQLGACTGACLPENLGLTHVGCDFYPTVTASIVLATYDFELVVINATPDDADITIEQDGFVVTQAVVPGDGVTTIPLWWVEPLKQSQGVPLASVVEPGGAYRLRSTRPIIVTQWNPLDNEGQMDQAGTADASLLLPAHAWDDDYLVGARATWQHPTLGHLPGFYAVTAREDATTVTLLPSPTGDADILPGGGVNADGSGVVMLDAGDVLEVFSGGMQANPSSVDLTGTRVVADAPIQVIGGHSLVQVPSTVLGRDHIEESMLPVSALGTQYVITPPFALEPGGATPAVKQRAVRIVATADNTTIAYNPAQAGQPTAIAQAGGYVDLSNSASSFEITTNQKVLVLEYMLGHDAGNINAGTNAGDPSIVVAKPVPQWQTSYRVHAPAQYYASFASIITDIGSDVYVDGVQIGGFFVFGGVWKLRRVQLDGAGSGLHTISASGPISVSVYGYGLNVGYWHTAGTGLAPQP